MKRLFLTLFFAAGIFTLWSQGEILFGKRLFLDEPRVHKIQQGEYLSKLAERYYGDPQRWRELALVNRAPNPDHVEVGEEILVPAANVASEISRARTLTKVNALFNEQEKLASREPSSPVTNDTPNIPSPEVTTGNETTSSPEEPVAETPISAAPEPAKIGSDFPWFWVGVGVVVLVLASAGFILYRRRQTPQAKADVGVRKNPEDFRPRRYYGDSAAVKTEAVDQDDDAKDKDTDFGESRRRRYTDSAPTTA